MAKNPKERIERRDESLHGREDICYSWIWFQNSHHALHYIQRLQCLLEHADLLPVDGFMRAVHLFEFILIVLQKQSLLHALDEVLGESILDPDVYLSGHSSEQNYKQKNQHLN